MASDPIDRAGAWHPLHGMLAAYPLVCFTGALVTDVTYANTAEMQWANFSVWLIAAGVIMGVLAAIAGIVDALRTRHTRRRSSWLHSLLTAATFVVAIVNGFIHSRDAWTSVVPGGLVLSAITAVLVLASSWMGYKMLGQRRAGVA
ncbi:DUF2231 domain-containing protein [Sphingomonas sp. ac-8]|uniref:DUF2231 domain-containing protein n=1 Tax=Sphingomonas sp. ac-8 TaxID=3242977 RepID=UPI003A805BC4